MRDLGAISLKHVQQQLFDDPNLRIGRGQTIDQDSVIHAFCVGNNGSGIITFQIRQGGGALRPYDGLVVKVGAMEITKQKNVNINLPIGNYYEIGSIGRPCVGGEEKALGGFHFMHHIHVYLALMAVRRFVESIGLGATPIVFSSDRFIRDCTLGFSQPARGLVKQRSKPFLAAGYAGYMPMVMDEDCPFKFQWWKFNNDVPAATEPTTNTPC